MITQLIYVGLTHRTAPVGVRERCAPDPSTIAERLRHLRSIADESVLLSTCGRLELYARSAVSDEKRWHRQLAHLTDDFVERISPYIQFKRDGSAARHLLRVAAGLDSQIVGEEHILTQVREAVERARQAARCGPVLSALFRSAVRAGKRVRHETTINRVPRSFARVAVDHLLAHRGSAAFSRVLILGSGRMAHDVAAVIPRRAGATLIVAGRDRCRADLLASQVGGYAIGLEGVMSALKGATVVFGCTSCLDYLITPTELATRAQALHLIDLGMPRNFDPSLGHLSGVHLVHLDDLVPATSLQTCTVRAANRIIDQEFGRLEQWCCSRQVAPRIAEMLRRVEGMHPEQARLYKRALHHKIVQLREEVAA